MAVSEHIINSTPYKLNVNGSPEGPLSNRDGGIAGIILRIEIFNFNRKSSFEPQ